ncbi:MAG: NAD-dependent epimerase/dehydratase family protein [Bacteriovoracaceae bacterium]|nr:NAD-dependent epimerase/dehydratase family protein [Bacteriovoracaceae bacterium]
METKNWNVWITGASGFIGSTLLRKIINEKVPFQKVYATDVRSLAPEFQHPKIEFIKCDVRDESLSTLMKKYDITHVIHLASIVTPSKKSNREFEFSVDVLGTRNILKSCIDNKVSQIITTSSGAAYGYYADLPPWIKESDPIRGNQEFPYSYHKRLVEEDLKTYRENYPELKQLILRPGTILGKRVNNQITDLFKKPVVLGIKGSDSPFVFIWDEDVVEIIFQGLIKSKEGIFNLAGDGAVSLKEIARILKRPYIPLPPKILEVALKYLKKWGLTQYGPEQLNFLRYRPVLDNKNLKHQFHFSPRYTSKECFLHYLEGAK